MSEERPGDKTAARNDLSAPANSGSEYEARGN